MTQMQNGWQRPQLHQIENGNIPFEDSATECRAAAAGRSSVLVEMLTYRGPASSRSLPGTDSTRPRFSSKPGSILPCRNFESSTIGISSTLLEGVDSGAVEDEASILSLFGVATGPNKALNLIFPNSKNSSRYVCCLWQEKKKKNAA